MSEHIAEVKRIACLQVRASCSCGSWLMVTAHEDQSRVKAWTFNWVCPATDLVFSRLKKARASA
jgi:hypothetical protein